MNDADGHRSTFRFHNHTSSKGITTMAAGPYSIDPTNYLDDLLAQASPDLMREMLQGFINPNPIDSSRPNLWRRLRHHV